MNEKLTIVLVHGFWGAAAHWGKVIVELSRKGYTKLRAVEMPLTSISWRDTILHPISTRIAWTERQINDASGQT